MLNFKIFSRLICNAFPIISSSLGLLLMGVTDTLVIAWLGESALAAQSLASFIHMAVFMTLVAFVFPIANVYRLEQAQGMPILKAGLLVTSVLALLISVFYFIGIPELIAQLLNAEQQMLFNAYLKTIALTLLPGALFFFCRMLLYTEDQPRQIGYWIVMCLILNAALDFWAILNFGNPVDVIRLIALITVGIFILLVFLTNTTLPKPKQLQAIMREKTSKKAFVSVLKTSTPAGITALGEYGFFAMLASMVALHAPTEAAAYRIILQIEEMLIIIFYALARVLSLEVSVANDAKLATTKSYYFHAASILLLALFLLPLFHPYILKAYNINIQFSQHYFFIITLLLLTEAGMLYICSFLWGFARYNTVAVITCAVNWGLILPALWLWSPTQIEIFYYALIVNYGVIGVLLLKINLYKTIR